MSRPLSKFLPELFIIVVLISALFLVYHYKFILPELEAARRIYVVDDERLANAKVVDMQKKQDLGVITSEEGIKEEFEAFTQILLGNLRDTSNGYPVFRRGSVILSDGVVDLTESVAGANGLDLNYSLGQYLEDLQKKLVEQRMREGQ